VTESTDAAAAAGSLVSAYEALRHTMIGEPASTTGWGLIVLIRQGLRAWMDAYGQSHSAVERQTSSFPEAGGRVGKDRHHQVTHILAEMVRAHFQEGAI